jgi:signal transduction histidine kinase
MSKFLQLLLVFIFLFSGITTKATTLAATTKQVNLLTSATFLEDPSGKLTIDQVSAKDKQFKPWSQGGDSFNFGFTRSAYWIKLPLLRQSDAAEEWLLEIEYAKLQELDFYSPDGAMVLTGSDRAFDSRPMFDRFFLFPVKVTAQTQNFYLRVSSRYALTVPLTLWTPRAYHETQQRLQAIQFLYYGGLIALAIYGLLVFFAIGDRRFALYCAYVVSAGLGIFASNGFGRLYLWRDHARFDEISQSLFLSLAGLLAVWFARRMTQVEHRSFLGQSLWLSQLMFALIIFMILWQFIYSDVLIPINQVLLLNSVLMGLLVTTAGVKAYRMRRNGIRFFLLGWIVLWFGVCIATLRAFNWLPSTILTSYAVQITTAIEMLLVAIALGELLREQHQAYIQSQAQSLADHRAILELSQISEEKLKLAVMERTLQLEASLQKEKNLREQYVRIGSMISHEFRTPLSIIHSQATLMRKEYDRGIDEVHKRLDAIRSASQRLKTMFDKWLYSDSLHETLGTLALSPLDLDSWVREKLQVQQELLTNHTLNYVASVSSGKVMADEYHLELVLSNLIDNAAKFAPVKSTITVEQRQKEGFNGVAVTDQGPGIPIEMQDNVFREFFTVAPESHVRGIGLGLSIVQRIVQAHGGHVELTSNPGCGATFCFWLPHAMNFDPTPTT